MFSLNYLYTYLLAQAADVCSPDMRGVSASGGSRSAPSDNRKQTPDTYNTKKRDMNDERRATEQMVYKTIIRKISRKTPAGIQTDFQIQYIKKEEISQDTDEENILSDRLRNLSLSPNTVTI